MKRIRKQVLNWIIRFIQKTDDEEINIIINAISKRYNKHFPDWELLFISLPKNPAKREKTLLDVLKFYRNHPEA